MPSLRDLEIESFVYLVAIWWRYVVALTKLRKNLLELFTTLAGVSFMVGTTGFEPATP